MSRWAWIPLLLGCAALVVVLLGESTTSEPAVPRADLGTQDPDLFLEGAVVTQFLRYGALQYELTSERIRHFEDVGITRLDGPDLEMREPRQPPWSARADWGEISDQPDAAGSIEEVVHLRDNVFLERTRGERFLSLSSDELFVYTERRYAETDRAVMIDSNAGRTKAVGLTADLRRNVLHLASSETQRVHTIVLPHQFQE